MLRAAAVAGCVYAAACSDPTGSQPLPAGTSDPATYHTPAGALGMRVAALYDLATALPSYVLDAGLLTDELESSSTGASAGVLGLPSRLTGYTRLDERILPDVAQTSVEVGGDNDYANLQKVRASVAQALGAFHAYYPQAPEALRGELYAVAGYAETLLADFYCSGVPLSTYDFEADFTYKPGSKTSDVYAHALALFDSALALSSDSARITNFARVGRGRALLALGRFAEADSAVSQVPDGFQYNLAIRWDVVTGSNNFLNANASVSNTEGINGLAYRDDPRSASDSTGQNDFHRTLYFPRKYPTTGYAQFPLADWIEARLIHAEAALHAGDATEWLAQLNALRANATVPGMTGTLAPLQDPVTDSARVETMFDERAYWLFATGHRQGDMRRLIRQYGRTQITVYPIGPYLAPGAAVYGTEVNAPVPPNERANPLFYGCLDRGA